MNNIINFKASNNINNNHKNICNKTSSNNINKGWAMSNHITSHVKVMSSHNINGSIMSNNNNINNIKSYYSGSQNLYNCHEFIRQQCNPLVMPFLQSRLVQPSSCQVLQQQCCHELRQVEPQYRNQAIYSMVQSIIQQQQPPCGLYGSRQDSQREVAMLTAAQYLPSMCGMYNSYYQSNPCSNNDASASKRKSKRT
ncbi:hypothetical protein U9M48_014482 [Paspalum notatum var. saurae]|uniref:Bifunctional inhibitor/plant lipid transfer protein/seed storage helical domain-containing protein n=1 Tax=Paspalum notatum var. saurae TaxID=547442 RepID=A0AAQ3T2R6_PASNO